MKGEAYFLIVVRACIISIIIDFHPLQKVMQNGN